MANKKKQNNNQQATWQDIVPAKNIPKARQAKLTQLDKAKVTKPKLLSLAKFSRLKRKLKKVKKRIWLLIIVIVLAILAGFVLYTKTIDETTPDAIDGESEVVVDTGADSDQPKYQTITPSGTSVDQFGGWTRVSPINSNPVFAYVDYIGNIPIRVSQQPLPDAFTKEDTKAQIDQLAIGYEKITAGDISVHIGTNSKGPQSVIFTKNGLLILITSNSKITNNQWASYISSLQ